MKIKDLINLKEEDLMKIIPQLNGDKLIEILEVIASRDKYNNILEQCLKNNVVFEKIVDAAKDYYDMNNIISKMDKSTKYRFFREKIDKNIFRTYLEKESYETILDELEEIMEIQGVIPDEIPDKVEIIMEMYETNNDIIRKIDYKLLENKYIEKLGLDKINLISCYPGIQQKILELSDKKLDVLVICIEDYMKDVQTEEWTTIANDILENLSTNEYDDLIEDIEDIEKTNIDLLKGILQSKNIYKIKSEVDMLNYEDIKQKRTDELIKSETIEDKRRAVIEKAFGQDDLYTKIILDFYAKDIDSLPESDIKYYVKSLKAIWNCESATTLEQIYTECKETTFVDKAMAERALKTEFGKLYNEDLLKVENLEEIGENIYSAGTDFKMIITSLNACRKSKCTENYAYDWNRPFIDSQTVSTSYIRNDMLGTASRTELCYGFDEMAPDSLIDSGYSDIESATEIFKHSSLGTAFLTPETQINETYQYNEMDYRRIQNGEKKQPSYIVVFKRNGNIELLENAKKAQKDWNGLPIVVVDIDACLESERAKIDSMMEEYETTQTPELAKQIYYKIRNNRQTDKRFCREIDIERFKPEEIILTEDYTEPKVTEEDLKENYDLVTPMERKQGVGKLKRIFTKIKEIRQEER